MSDIKVTAN